FCPQLTECPFKAKIMSSGIVLCIHSPSTVSSLSNMIHNLPVAKAVVVKTKCFADCKGEKIRCRKGETFFVIAIAGNNLSYIKKDPDDKNERDLVIENIFIEDAVEPSTKTNEDRAAA
ncbi:hypothetical protein KW799_02790, partial [Candidatus Parcubacteria bacterium]|nr:hypothetical protein [Candidatus Parcubacteria bacterium]